MQSLDSQVIEQALQWAGAGETIWLCTVLSTFGSSPREPGSMMVAKGDGAHRGSLSGGCVEEDFLERLVAGACASSAMIIRYGAPGQVSENPRVRLPCGGRLDILVERLAATPVVIDHLERLQASLAGEPAVVRHVRLADGALSLAPAEPDCPRVQRDESKEMVRVTVAPVARLILAGYSPVAEACAGFALSLGYQVVLCDPREDVTAGVQWPAGVEFVAQLPSVYLAATGACTDSTAVVATTHDPRIDDLAMMAAVKTPAGYIGAMGSRNTSRARAERLRRIGGLNAAEIARIHMPIGLDIGSRTPAEIALAIMADIVRVRRGGQPIRVEQELL
ncbi:MAG TPA: XdhC family protein [Marinobacter sp.]|nr:XdhC family protein [Marinobacter sp.]